MKYASAPLGDRFQMKSASSVSSTEEQQNTTVTERSRGDDNNK